MSEVISLLPLCLHGVDRGKTWFTLCVVEYLTVEQIAYDVVKNGSEICPEARTDALLVQPSVLSLHRLSYICCVS
jgi:hypothetical protein